MDARAPVVSRAILAADQELASIEVGLDCHHRCYDGYDDDCFTTLMFMMMTAIVMAMGDGDGDGDRDGDHHADDHGMSQT